MKRFIFSFDAETNGLWGQAFSIAAVVMEKETREIVETFIGRCPIEGNINEWVEQNVLPEMKDVEVNCKDYTELLQNFISFYVKYKDEADVIVHMGLPVEAKLFLDAHNMGILGDWDAPYPLIDISAFPEIEVSVDTYNKNHGISFSYSGSTHNPLYDSYAALYAYENLINKEN